VFHEIEELHQRGDGTVLWRGISVEHYTFPETEEGQAQEREAAHELAAQCRHLEALGVHVSRVNYFPWFDEMTTETPVEYRAFIGGLAGELLEHGKEGSLAWQFAFERPVPKHGPQETTEVRALYVWKDGRVERRDFVTSVTFGSYHAVRALGCETADCGQGRYTEEDRGHPLGKPRLLWDATWEQVRAMLSRHRLTPEALAAHVLPLMSPAPEPPKPVSTLAEAKRALLREVRRGLRESDGSLPEADDDINDASRVVVEFMAKENDGEAWLGQINLYGNDRHGGAPVMWRWDGAPVYNFGASFVSPQHDAELERLIRERDDAPYTSVQADAERVDAILARLEEIGGVSLHWT